MKYSEVKAKILEARRLGLQKLPRGGWWVKRFRLHGGQVVDVALSNTEILYSQYPLESRLALTEEEYMKMWRGR